MLIITDDQDNRDATGISNKAIMDWGVKIWILIEVVYYKLFIKFPELELKLILLLKFPCSR